MSQAVFFVMFVHLLSHRGVFQGQGIRGHGYGYGLWAEYKRCVVTQTRETCVALL